MVTLSLILAFMGKIALILLLAIAIIMLVLMIVRIVLTLKHIASKKRNGRKEEK